MLLSHRKNGLTSLFKEVRVLKVNGTMRLEVGTRGLERLGASERPVFFSHSQQFEGFPFEGWQKTPTRDRKKGSLQKGSFHWRNL